MPLARTLALVLFGVALPASAVAYLDAGSASVLFQAAAAALFSGAFVLKAYWANIRAWFSRSKPPSPPSAP